MVHNSADVEIIHHHWKSLYFSMTLSCMEAIQSFISHFNQYSLVDPFWGYIPNRVYQGVKYWFRKLERRVYTTVILETEFHGNISIFISHPDKHKRNWKIVSTINVTYAPLQIDWARNIAFNYIRQQQTALSFTTLSNVVVLLCEVRP